MAKAIHKMNDEPKGAPRKEEWKWLRILNLLPWAGLALSATALAGALLAAAQGQGSYSVMMFLSGVTVWLMVVFLLAAPISILLHVVALFKQRAAPKSAYLGIISGLLATIGILVLAGYAGARFD